MMTRIAIYQAQSGIEPERNAELLVAAVGQAAAGGAAMLFTPEMSNMLDRVRERALASARSEEDDHVLAAVRKAAVDHRMWVHLGSLAVLGSGGKLANRGFVIDPNGEVRARYDKLHLFDVDVPGGESWRESAIYQAGGEALALAGTPVGTLGLSICYDIRFPDLYARLSEAGATAISVPAAFTVPTGRAHWHILLRARAIESACFIIAAAQTGRHEDGRETFGHSLVIDPWGDILLDMKGEVGVGFAEVQLGRLEEVRSRIPVLAHRRPISNVRVV